MQDATNESREALDNEPMTQAEAVEVRKEEAPAAEVVPQVTPQDTPVPRENTRSALLPQKGLSYALIAGAIAGVAYALLTIVIILINTGLFHVASLQIAADRLTVNTALALAGVGILNFVLGLLIVFITGFIVGKIAIRRRNGFLAGVLAGAIFYIITFLASLFPSYPGNLTVHSAPITTGGLVISFLLLCLWSIGGGLVSLFGTWVATVRHAYYQR